MNKTTLRILIIGGGIVLLTIILILCFTLLRPTSPAPIPQSSAPTQTSYVLREYEGKIALYETSQTEPQQVFEIYTNTLPELDIQRLQKGIPVESIEEAQSYLEDFDS